MIGRFFRLITKDTLSYRDTGRRHLEGPVYVFFVYYDACLRGSRGVQIRPHQCRDNTDKAEPRLPLILTSDQPRVSRSHGNNNVHFTHFLIR